MQLEYSQLDSGIRLIKLNGVLDMNGTYASRSDFVRIAREKTSVYWSTYQR